MARTAFKAIVAGGRRIWTIVGVLLTIVIIVLLANTALLGMGEAIRRMTVYREVEAEVISHVAPDEDAEDAELRTGRIEYRYTVNGTTYNGVYSQDGVDSFWQFEKPFMFEARAGGRMAAFYDPDFPEKSTLWTGVEPLYLSLSVFFVPFLTLMVWGCGHQVRRLRVKGEDSGKRWERPGFGFGAWVFIYFIASGVVCFTVLILRNALGWKASAIICLAAIPLLPTIIVVGVRRANRRRAMAARVEPELSRRERKTRRERQDALILCAGTVFWWFVTSLMVVQVWAAPLRMIFNRGRYVQVEGEVKRCWIAKHDDVQNLVIEYQYRVDGKEYVSRRQDFGHFKATYDGEDFPRQRDEHPPGRKLRVYYDPADPSQAVLRLDLPWKKWAAVFFAVPFVAIGIFLIIKVTKMLRETRVAPAGLEGTGRHGRGGRRRRTR